MCCVYLQCYFYIQILNGKEMYSVLCIVGADYVLICCVDLSGREIKRLGSQINYELQKGFELVCINMLLNVTFVACVFPVWMFPFYGMVFEHWVWFSCVTLLWRIIHRSHDSLVLFLHPFPPGPTSKPSLKLHYAIACNESNLHIVFINVFNIYLHIKKLFFSFF